MRHLLFLLVFLIQALTGRSQPANHALNDSLLLAAGITVLDTNAVRTLSQKCWELRNTDVSSATVYGKLAIDIARRIGFRAGLAQALNQTGVVYRNRENYPKALELLLEAKTIAQEDSILTELGYAFNNIGEIYRYEKNYNESIRHIQKALDIFTRLNNLTGMGYATIRLGEVSVDAGLYDQALSYYEHSARIRKQMGDERNYSVVLNREGELNLLTGKYQEAMESLGAALDIRTRLQDDRGRAETLTTIGAVYLKQGNYPKAIGLASEGLAVARKVNSYLRIYAASDILTRAYAGSGNYRQAWEIQQVFIQYKDSVFSLEKSRQITSIIENTTEREQQARIDALERETRLQEEEANRKNLVLIIVVAAFSISTLMIIFLFKAYRDKRRAFDLMEAKNEEIRKQRDEITFQAESLTAANQLIQESNQQLSHINQALITEINERKQIEMALLEAKQVAEAATRAKSRFISTMSHEIRTPMNAVIGITDWLLQDQPKPEQTEYLQSLKFAANNLMAILSDILDFSKIEAGKLDIESVPFSLSHLCQNLVNTYRTEASRKGLLFSFEAVSPLSDRLLGDPVRMGQVLTNLISNAIKFTRSGSVQLRLTPQKTSENGAIPILFEVIDSGIGIPPEQQIRIFESFTQASSATTREFGGTGLGLSIVQKLIHLMGGQIRVKSELGKGSTFYFTLTFRPASEMRETSDSETPSTIDCLMGKKVLLVDDNHLNVKMASRFLTRWGMEVDTADNGALAVEKATQTRYDIILMDIQMPVMDGLTASRKIRMERPDQPIFALTADAMEENREQVFNEGLNGLIIKPFKSEDIRSKLERLFPSDPA